MLKDFPDLTLYMEIKYFLGLLWIEYLKKIYIYSRNFGYNY